MVYGSTWSEFPPDQHEDNNYNDGLNDIVDIYRAEVKLLTIENNELKAKLALRSQVPLTDDQIYDHLCYAGLLGAVGLNTDPLFLYIARAIEKAHNIV